MIMFTNTTLPLYSNNTARHKVMQQAAEHITLSEFILILLPLYYPSTSSDLFLYSQVCYVCRKCVKFGADRVVLVLRSNTLSEKC